MGRVRPQESQVWHLRASRIHTRMSYFVRHAKKKGGGGHCSLGEMDPSGVTRTKRGADRLFRTRDSPDESTSLFFKFSGGYGGCVNSLGWR